MLWAVKVPSVLECMALHFGVLYGGELLFQLDPCGTGTGSRLLLWILSRRIAESRVPCCLPTVAVCPVLSVIFGVVELWLGVGWLSLCDISDIDGGITIIAFALFRCSQPSLDLFVLSC